MARRVAVAFVIIAASLAAIGEDALDPDVRAVLDRFESLRPSAKELAWYQLDWAGTLEEAKRRAANEKRPICLLVCLNVFGNLYTGHC